MDLHEPDIETGASRMELLTHLREALEDMDWRNLQLAERLLSPYHLTLPQVAVLSVLHHEGPDLEMSQIAARTGLPPSSITSIMDRLLLRRFVERKHHPSDRRRVTGSITESGLQVIREIGEKRRAIVKDLLADFSDEDLALLSRMARRWTAMTEQIIAKR